MANQILNTPGGAGQVPAGQVLVGDRYTGDLTTFNGKIFVIDLENLPDPYNPLNLPKNTIRVRFNAGYTPPSTLGDTQELVDSTRNIWDIYQSSNNWNGLFSGNSEIIEVLGGNTKNVTGMGWMFHNCSSLVTVNLFSMENVVFGSLQNFAMFNDCTSLVNVPQFYFPKLTILSQMFYNCQSLITVPKFETAHVTSMYNMFAECSSLTTIPKFNMSNVTNCDFMFRLCTSLTSIPLFDLSKIRIANDMFNSCYNVEQGALAIYNSIKDNPPERYERMFQGCGRDTQTGAAELAQIPSDWK